MHKLIKANISAITIIIVALINILIVLVGNFKCPWNETFDIYCVGCGGTRMFYSLLKLEFYQAFRYNPFIFILLILLIIYINYIIICKILKKKYYKLNIKHLIIISAIAIIFMILRNIEYFSYLQPTKI